VARPEDFALPARAHPVAARERGDTKLEERPLAMAIFSGPCSIAEDTGRRRARWLASSSRFITTDFNILTVDVRESMAHAVNRVLASGGIVVNADRSPASCRCASAGS
jgi:hypothetical protein